MIRLVNSSVFLVASMIWVNVSCSKEESARLRADCIVEINLQWPRETSTRDKVKTAQEMLKRIRSSSNEGRITSSPDVAIQGKELELLYLQFSMDCDGRMQSAGILMQSVLSRVPGTPAYSISNSRIEPGPNTIEVWGPSWTDRPAWAKSSDY